jgi:long-chain acyl-CoA synthetase
MEFETLAQFLDEISNSFSHKSFCSYGEKSYSYKELKEFSICLSHWFISCGLNKSDRIAIWSQNRAEWVITFFGAISAGGVVVGVDDYLPLHEAYYILKDCEARFLFISSKHINDVKKFYFDLPNLKKIVCFDGNEEELFLNFWQEINSIDKNKQPLQISPSDLAVLIYTSGTTGKLKAIMLNHKNLIANLRQIVSRWKLEKEDKFLSILPLSHVFELTAGLLFPLYFGIEIYYPTSKNIRQIFKEVKEKEPTIILVVPAILRLLRNQIIKNIKYKKLLNLLAVLNSRLVKPIRFLNIKKKIFPKLKFFVCGGAPISKKLLIELKTLGFEILYGYGLSEASPVVSVNIPEENKIGSTGKPLPGIEVAIKNSNIGEILVKGENVMLGYYKNEDLTEETIKEDWLYTGDLGYIDRDGFLWVIGRAKNVIVDEKGRNIYPEEVEELLKTSPLVKDACIVGIKSEEGEKILAVIVPEAEIVNLKEKEELIGKEISKINKLIPSYKKIQNYKIIEEMPYTSTRKVRRGLLKQMLKTNK